MGTAELHRIRLQPLISLVALACLPVPLVAQTGKHPNYDDDVKPIFARYCFACHNASEMRSGLNLEAYSGVLKGGGSGDAVIAGRAASSLLYKAVAREEGALQMPLGNPKIPDAAIATIRDWIASGLLENAASQPKGPVAPSLEFKPTSLNKPEGAPAMPQSLPPFTLDEPSRAHPVTAMAASPWAPLVAVAGHERIYLYNLDQRVPAGELAFPEGIPYTLHFSRDGSTLLAAGGRGRARCPIREGRSLRRLSGQADGLQWRRQAGVCSRPDRPLTVVPDSIMPRLQGA